jgi:hypothetical protein
MSKLNFNLNVNGKLSISSTQPKIPNKETQLSFYLLLMENMDFLMENYEILIDTPDYYFSPVPGAWISSAFVSRSRGELFLGDLLTLWKNDLWTSLCPECGDSVYLLNAGGSPLSGRGGASGICKGCRTMIYHIQPFGKYFGQIMQLKVLETPEDLNSISLQDIICLINITADD